MGAALRRHVESGFEQQAEALGKRAAEARARDPLAVQLLATFTRQARDRAARAALAQAAGDHVGAVALAESAMVAVENERRVREAIAGLWDGTGER